MLAARVQCFLVWCGVMLLGMVFLLFLIVLCCLSILRDVCVNSSSRCITAQKTPGVKFQV